MKTKGILKLSITIVAIVILIVFGFLWLKNSQFSTDDKYAGLTTYIDKNLTDERAAELNLQEQTLTASLENDSTSLENWRDLGLIRYELGDLAGAAEAYEQAVEINPLNYPSWASLGDMRKHMGDYIGAELAYTKAIELYPNEDDYYYKLIDLWQRYIPERDEDIHDMLVWMIQNLGQDRESLVHLAEWYMDHGEYEEAVSHYEVALQYDPENEDLQEDLEEAKRKYRESR